MTERKVLKGWAWTQNALDVAKVHFFPHNLKTKRRNQQWVKPIAGEPEDGWFTTNVYVSKKAAVDALHAYHAEKHIKAQKALNTVTHYKEVAIENVNSNTEEEEVFPSSPHLLTQ